MPVNPFIGLAKADLVKIRTVALEEVTTGKTMVSASAGGKAFSKLVNMSAQDRLRFANDELRRIDPTNTAWGGPRITRTHARYYPS